VRRGGAVALAAGLAAGPIVACSGRRSGPPPGAPIAGIEEASGVIRVGSRLLVVGDHEPGTYYSLDLEPGETGRIRLRPDRLRRHRIGGGPYAMDLEAIDVLADGRIVILSERMSALLDSTGPVAVYGRDLAEVGGRGCEGLAVRPLPGGASRVAVLWEGGYPEAASLPRLFRDRAGGRAAAPTVVVHDIPAGASGLDVGPAEARRIELRVPLPAGVEPYAQRFRAPDLVWHRLDPDDDASWGFVVLLSSGWGRQPDAGTDAECPKIVNGRPLRWCYKWLQRFTTSGEPVGDPFDLDGVLPGALTHVNWEGMGWFVPGESVVLVYDERVAERTVDPQEAIVVPLPAGW
jgi:hypothetical protein